MKKSILNALVRAEQVKGLMSADGEDVHAYLKGMLDKQNEATKGKNDEQAGIDSRVIDAMSEEAMFCSDIANGLGLTSSKVSASLQRLIKSGKVEKDFDIEKKLNTYKRV